MPSAPKCVPPYFHIEYIISRQHGGPFALDNLALSCWFCNLKKGPNLTGVDPESGRVTPLFHPRKDWWPDHFVLGFETLMRWGIEIQGVSAVGRTTVRVLGINEEMRQMLRYELWREAKYGVGR